MHYKVWQLPELAMTDVDNRKQACSGAAWPMPVLLAFRGPPDDRVTSSEGRDCPESVLEVFKGS